MTDTDTDTAARAIFVDGLEILDKSYEVARLWVEDGGPATCIIQPERLESPEMFGLLIVDTIRHAAVAFSQCYGTTEADTLARIWSGVNAERDFETSPIETLQDYRKHNS